MVANTLSVINLECSRGDQLLFSDLNFSLSATQALLVTGANGVGKLLYCVF